ncbi:hypothetical protein NQZ68_033006 [Dissostichus eleginoides]|nr:hypothetical protein NQZ68_033006 [Dissostichus eleginoides]
MQNSCKEIGECMQLGGGYDDCWGESAGARCVRQRLIDVPVVSALHQIPFN